MPFIELLQCLKVNARESVKTMQQRIKRYDIHKWASEFMDSLQNSIKRQSEHHARKISEEIKSIIFTDFNKAESRNIIYRL